MLKFRVYFRTLLYKHIILIIELFKGSEINWRTLHRIVVIGIFIIINELFEIIVFIFINFSSRKEVFY